MIIYIYIYIYKYIVCVCGGGRVLRWYIGSNNALQISSSWVQTRLIPVSVGCLLRGLPVNELFIV